MGFYGLEWVFMEFGGFLRLGMGGPWAPTGQRTVREPVDKCVICAFDRIGTWIG